MTIEKIWQERSNKYYSLPKEETLGEILEDFFERVCDFNYYVLGISFCTSFWNFPCFTQSIDLLGEHVPPAISRKT